MLPPPAAWRLGAALAVAVALAVGSCGPQRNVFAPACPIAGLVKPLDELTRYSGASRDLTGLVIRARIVDVGGKCRPGGDDTVRVTTQVAIDVTRGPALAGGRYELPLFVAVTDTSAVLDKRLFALTVSFEPNVDTARAVSPEVEMELPVTKERSAAAYGVIAGFQLTPEEIALARRTPRR